MEGKSEPFCLERQDTICYAEGSEGFKISKDAYKGGVIGVFTSGGDSQGMNAAVRAVVRTGIYVGCRVFLIKEGYDGMVRGSESIIEADWKSVTGIIQKGGTVIGSARSPSFRQREGRLKAATNLIKNGITNLVVIGGDGSLTGANIFRQEWPDLLQELKSTGLISVVELMKYSYLNIVGMVGSIDNDFSGTDMTIGTDSALHRIIEATDNIATTAFSHQRCFVLEVMGRNCGYLGIVSAIASGADYVFIPECPPPADWESHLCEKLVQERASGKRLNIIIVSEGARDKEGKKITAEGVKQLIVDKLHYDTRVTILGHVQRGGNPSAFDRVLGCRMGADAVDALMQATPETPASVISICGNKTVRVPLMQCVEKTLLVQKAMQEGNYDKAVELRGRAFLNNWNMFRILSARRLVVRQDNKSPQVNIGLINVGAPACGMNDAMKSFVRLAINAGHRVLGIKYGFGGLLSGQVRELCWSDVQTWTGVGGTILGTDRLLPSECGLKKVAQELERWNISSMLIIGGFEAFHSGLLLHKHRKEFPSFCIPICIIPATISNNVPGSDFSIGADTALNEISEICDKIKQSASGTKQRVFVIETMGGHCGYLATMAGLAGGADAAYIFEEAFSIKDLENDVKHMKQKIEDGVKRALILRNEKANDNYTTEFIHKLYSEEGRGIFSSRVSVLGHLQQGGRPTPFDRNMGIKMAAKCLDRLTQQMKEHMTEEGKVHCTADNTACLLGLIGKQSQFSALSELEKISDFKLRYVKKEYFPGLWWMKLRNLLRILAKHESVYQCNTTFAEEIIDEETCIA